MSPEPTDADRYPTLTEDGRRILEFMREHPSAPIYRNQSGNRLTPSEVEELQQFETQTRSATVGWPAKSLPDWLPEFVKHTFGH